MWSGSHGNHSHHTKSCIIKACTFVCTCMYVHMGVPLSYTPCKGIGDGFILNRDCCQTCCGGGGGGGGRLCK